VIGMLCSFCNNEISKGTGIMFVYKDGTSLTFCSSKCRKNQLGLGREGRRSTWTNHGVVLEVHQKVEKKESAAAKDIEEKLAAKKAAEAAKKGEPAKK
jgi:large subunit ribosomal protein L24e